MMKYEEFKETVCTEREGLRMCKLLLLNKICLGNRELGYELVDLNKLEVIEMTAGQIKSALKAGKEILGVKVSAGNELELDKEKYFMTNIIRDIPMSDGVYELFKRQKKYQKSMRIRDDISIDGCKGFVFTAKTGNPYTHEAIVRATKLIVKRANEWEAERAKQEKRTPVVIRVHTPHIWRHTFTTRLIEKGVPSEMVMPLLGHASIKITMDIYAHINPKNCKRLITDVSGMLDIL